MADSPQELLRQMRDQLGLLPQRLAELFEKQQQGMSQGQMPGQPLERDSHGRFLPRGEQGQEDNPYRLPTGEAEDIAHRASRLMPALRPVAQGITKIRETLELIEKIEKFVEKMNRKPEIEKPQVPAGFREQSQSQSFEAFLRRQFEKLPAGQMPAPAAKAPATPAPSTPAKNPPSQSITTAPAAAPPVPKPLLPPTPAIPAAKPVPQPKPLSISVAQATAPPTPADWRTPPPVRVTPPAPSAPTVAQAPAKPPTPPAPAAPKEKPGVPAIPLFLKPEHLGLTPAQAARKATDAAIAAGKSPAEAAQVQQRAFDFAHENTTNRGAIHQRELLRAMERGMGMPEAMRFAAAQVARSRPTALPTAPIASALPQTAPTAGRNVVPEMQDSQVAQLTEAVKDMATAIKNNTKELAKGRKEQGQSEVAGGGQPAAPMPFGGIPSHESTYSPSAKHSSTLDVVHLLRAGAKLFAAAE